jgi:hypothetical protein
MNFRGVNDTAKTVSLTPLNTKPWAKRLINYSGRDD